MIGQESTYANFSHHAPQFENASLPGILFTYSEVEFILAEAAARPSITVPGTAEEHYIKGGTSSILYWGGTTAEATTYLAQPKMKYAPAIATRRVALQCLRKKLLELKNG